jgi:hypothetical protein
VRVVEACVLHGINRSVDIVRYDDDGLILDMMSRVVISCSDLDALYYCVLILILLLHIATMTHINKACWAAITKHVTTTMYYNIVACCYAWRTSPRRCADHKTLNPKTLNPKTLILLNSQSRHRRAASSSFANQGFRDSTRRLPSKLFRTLFSGYPIAIRIRPPTDKLWAH